MVTAAPCRIPCEHWRGAAPWQLTLHLIRADASLLTHLVEKGVRMLRLQSP